MEMNSDSTGGFVRLIESTEKNGENDLRVQ
jgi:hypothetical protein